MHTLNSTPLGQFKPSSVSIEDDFIAVGIPGANSGLGSVKIFNSVSLEEVHVINGVEDEAEQLG